MACDSLLTTSLLQVVNRLAACKLIVKTCYPQACCKMFQQVEIMLQVAKSLKIGLFATCQLETWYNLLKQVVASPWKTSYDNQLATGMLTTCNRLVFNKLS